MNIRSPFVCSLTRTPNGITVYRTPEQNAEHSVQRTPNTEIFAEIAIDFAPPANFLFRAGGGPR